jgi:tRNA pseudouridine38-40 synthase
MPTFKLVVAYDGTGLVGWQRQAAGVSVQGLLEEALGALEGRAVPVAGAGRTDAGVHAIGQVASVSIDRAIDGSALVAAINARLPAAVRVLEAHEVPTTFHARFDARSKTYRYRVWNGAIANPFERQYSWHVPGPPLNVDAMAAAAALLEGRHDFAAMQATGSDAKTTERVVFLSRVHYGNALLRDAALITYEVTGSGFLRHMVRAIAGTLVDVGRGRHLPEDVSAMLASKDRGRAGPTAPAEGLFLVRVDYDHP